MRDFELLDFFRFQSVCAIDLLISLQTNTEKSLPGIEITIALLLSVVNPSFAFA